MRTRLDARLMVGCLAFACACSSFSSKDDELAPPTGTGDAAVPPPADGATSEIDAGADGDAQDVYAQKVLAAGPRAYFRFEDAAGPSCANEVAAVEATCIYPTSGLTLGVAGSGSGRRGVRLDAGTHLVVSGVMDYAGQAPFTVEAWLFLDPTPADFNVFKNADYGGNGLTGEVMFLVDERVRTETWSSGTMLFWGASLPVAQSKVWHHVVYGYSSMIDKDFVYVDGQVGDGGRLNDGGRVAPASGLVFGGAPMVIDDLAIYSRALSSAEISAHYLAR